MTTTPPVELPRYVLLDQSRPIGPDVATPDSKPECIAIHGFSDKNIYDAFVDKSERALTPYPLVRGFLQKQVHDHDGVILLVTLDAAGPCEATLNASTMQAILDAHENRSKQVSVSHRLSQDESSQSYHID